MRPISKREQTSLPWDIHPALTADRLTVCARLLAAARRDAIAMASYEFGDDPWSVGCRAYSFGRSRLARTAREGQYNWLGILDDTHHFIFLIEGVPIRFYRGLADEPSSRTLRQARDEADQLNLALGGCAEAELIFRLALEAASAGEVQRVVFLALRRGNGRAECFWPVPLTQPHSASTAVKATQLKLLPDDGPEPSSDSSPRDLRPRPAVATVGRQRRLRWAAGSGRMASPLIHQPHTQDCAGGS